MWGLNIFQNRLRWIELCMILGIGAAMASLAGCSNGTAGLLKSTASMPGMSLQASSSSVTLAPGSITTTTISVVGTNGFNSNVQLTGTGLPSGVKASFSPSTTTTSSKLTLTSSSSVKPGNYTATITGTSGAASSSVSIALKVATSGFSLSSSAGTLSLTPGSSQRTTISVVSENGFSGSVSLTSSGLPSGVTATFSPSSTTSTSTVTFTASSTVASGTYAATITGSSSSSASSSTVVSLNVTSGATQSTSTAGPTTWYVRPDGGTRYSSANTSGQCNGKYNAAYPGTGVNQNCAFGDIRFLWSDGSYQTNVNAGAPGWGWIGAGGDTYIIEGGPYRIGWSNPSTSMDSKYGFNTGLAGDPYDSGAPKPPSGTAANPTRILGSNYANCTSASARTVLHPGYGAGVAFNLRGVSFVQIACFDISDQSNCGRASQASTCNTTPGSLSDYAGTGVVWNNATTHTSVTDVSIHGMSANGMQGPTGDGDSLLRVSLKGNAASGWNMDNGDGTTGSGTLTLSYVDVEWNGCAEEYPIVDAVPYGDCTDDNSGGYGDGIGTATVTSNPAWIVQVDHSTAAYNTQDGFDLLHLQGGGSRLTITNSLAYGNMGQQLKVGAAGTAINNVIVGNCNALRQAIPGTPSGYNSRLSDFCRAADTAVVMEVQDGSTTFFDFNTVYAANATALEVDCNMRVGCTGTDLIDYRNNVFLGFLNNKANGYPGGGTGDYSNPIYVSTGVFANSGSFFDHNLTYHPKSNWTCPKSGLGETNGLCVDPQLTNETWPLYGYDNVTPLAGSPVIGAGISLNGITTDYSGASRPNPPSVGALEP